MYLRARRRVHRDRRDSVSTFTRPFVLESRTTSHGSPSLCPKSPNPNPLLVFTCADLGRNTLSTRPPIEVIQKAARANFACATQKTRRSDTITRTERDFSLKSAPPDTDPRRALCCSDHGSVCGRPARTSCGHGRRGGWLGGKEDDGTYIDRASSAQARGRAALAFRRRARAVARCSFRRRGARGGARRGAAWTRL